MGKEIRITCDLCGGRDMGCYIIIKVKRRWFGGYGESGMERKKIYICEDCQESLQAAARSDRKLREEKERKICSD